MGALGAGAAMIILELVSYFSSYTVPRIAEGINSVTYRHKDIEALLKSKYIANCTIMPA